MLIFMIEFTQIYAHNWVLLLWILYSIRKSLVHLKASIHDLKAVLPSAISVSWATKIIPLKLGLNCMISDLTTTHTAKIIWQKCSHCTSASRCRYLYWMTIESKVKGQVLKTMHNFMLRTPKKRSRRKNVDVEVGWENMVLKRAEHFLSLTAEFSLESNPVNIWVKQWSHLCSLERVNIKPKKVTDRPLQN